MNDREYLELQLRMTIIPYQVRWPAPSMCTGSACTRSPTKRVSG